MGRHEKPSVTPPSGMLLEHVLLGGFRPCARTATGITQRASPRHKGAV